MKRLVLATARGGQPIHARALLIRRQLPRRRDPTLLLEAMQRRIERSRVDLQHVARAGLDRLRDAVAVLRAPLERLQDE